MPQESEANPLVRTGVPAADLSGGAWAPLLAPGWPSSSPSPGRNT